MGELWRESVVVAASMTGGFGLAVAWWRMRFEKALTEHKLEVDRQLERAKGEIHRDVERDLKFQESRLRVAAELELRMHDREWQTLEEVARSCMETYQALFQAVMTFKTADQQNTVLADWAPNKHEYWARFVELKGHLARVPEDLHDRWTATVNPWREIIDAISAQTYDILAGKAQHLGMEWLYAQSKKLEDTMTAAAGLQREWRSRLQRANVEILRELRAPRA